MEELKEQQKNSTPEFEAAVNKEVENRKKDWLLPFQFKKGQSGNPKGRPPGRSVKERARAMLSSMSDEEFEDFLHGMDKKTIWEMAEGKPKQDMDITAEVTTKIIAIDE